MQIEQRYWLSNQGWSAEPSELGKSAGLVFVFGSPQTLVDPRHLAVLHDAYPKAVFFGCSTAGEICGTRVFDDSLVVTAVRFDSTRIAQASVEIGNNGDTSAACGERLVKMLDPKGLTHVLVLSDGVHVNGSELVRGMLKHVPPGVQITGGLSGDGTRFERTFVLSNGGPAERRVAAMAFYGSRLKVGYGSLGGWDSFGPERMITRSKANVLYELDNRPALGLYKEYLGEHAAGLPATGLLFPLSIRLADGEQVVRTILGVDEKEQSMTFAGDVPEGVHGRLMKANFDRLIDGALGAAKTSYEAIGSTSPDLAILISCIGRKLVLKQRIEEELEATAGVLGSKTVLTGFYSYGEICPSAPNANCSLHNQTMTITTFAER